MSSVCARRVPCDQTTHFLLFALLCCAAYSASMSDIPAELLDLPVSDDDITTIAAKYLVSWEELSPYLGLTKQDENEVREDSKKYSLQKRQALRRWKKNEGDAATYRAFIAAATEASNMELVDRVKNMLGKTEKPTGKTMGPTSYHLTDHASCI